MERICLIGFGYWGKIIYKNLSYLGYQNIELVDDVLGNLDKLDDTYDCYFIITPFTSHYEILKKIGNYYGKKIWCEKPLVETTQQANEIYSLIESNNNRLFVDWIYTFNPVVDKIKEIISNKKIKQIILNRTNDGPMRYDCTSIHDLSSHDLSMLYYIFDKQEFNFHWNEFSIKTNEELGSNVSWSYKDGIQIIINSSWQHRTKNRISLFITEDDEVIVFNDTKKTILTNDGLVDLSNTTSPLHLAMNYFFTEENFMENKELTLKITKNIEHAV